ncbi:hypothetical protein [Neolewinella agarilytica]|uniref:Uncharacterized protein n=1 Tax=Neolewinella agarilytica TaxID=478744 RepID=A0A1H9LY65_9BACT|nr:hypothetical protein [Neolewinella agarilytica]SER16308.1 hypothetical protein SAMN05444359_12632 [Neolewinella agarilytica]
MYPNNNRGIATKMAQEMAVSMGMSKDVARPHQLHLIVELDPNKNEYLVSINERDQKYFPSIGLSDRDGFLAVGMSVGVLGAPMVNGVPVLSAALPVSHADAAIFDGPAANAGELTEAQQVNLVFMSKFTLTSGTNKRIEDHATLPFCRVPETQSSGTTKNVRNGCEIVPLGASIGFAGADKSNLTFRVDGQDRSLIAGTADRKNFLYVILDGAILEGANNFLFAK